MSKYTTEVRFICESEAGYTESKGANNVDTIISASLVKIFNFDFPIFDETYRPILEKKILKHYYTREIGEETYGLWKLRLNTRLNEIMPYYNKLYSSELLEFNPLYSKNITIDHQGTGNVQSTNNGTSTGSSTSTNLNKYSDTPQGSLQNVLNGSYLTNATVDEATGSSTDTTQNTGTVNSIDNYIEKITGYEGYNPNKLLKDFRETFLNIDMMIINELNDLFMQLW